MATASKIHLSPEQKPEFYVQGISAEAAETASQLLQENHEKHHIFFNKSGFHNHIAHHLLTLYALNATPAQLRKAYADNVSYQRPPVALEQSVVEDMHVTDRFKTYLGKEKYYHDFLVFFKKEIEKHGWEDVVKEYVFQGDERADDILVRMFAGFLHPIIHLGFGIEFAQPAIIAEALAQACVHDSWIGSLFHSCEAAAAKSPDLPARSIVELLQEIREDEKLSKAAHYEDGNKIRDGVLKRAGEEMVRVASRYKAPEDELQQRTAEMINAAVYFTSASQHPPHIPKFDFYYIHSANASLFFTRFQTLSFLAPATRARLLEWKVRFDLAMYASRACPRLDLSSATDYASRQQAASWADVFARVCALSDDGHAAKLVRVLAHGEGACAGFEDAGGFVVKGGVWRVLGNMAVDSVEAAGPKWVRSAGFEEVWRDVPEREEGARL
ncbi:hypothetical protein K505DRAFT_325335 [Melanomma pulvis-pyrius CBS 109.77]|uniref:HypA-like protein n=1 Tax=Melanomma pulvis-pyrius CBS 109.77 TaxID=1314802 RepID=A0A6A6XBY8_9PLEO|nr:hypothetical protein K505DRAFT_325335 [Melanomma pulvis-pyrius CBS 109.77]